MWTVPASPFRSSGSFTVPWLGIARGKPRGKTSPNVSGFFIVTLRGIAWQGKPRQLPLECRYRDIDKGGLWVHDTVDKCTRAHRQASRRPAPALLVLVCLIVPLLVGGCEFHKASPVLYWGSVPTNEGVARLSQLGIKRIINLRTNSHKGRSQFAESRGIDFHHIKTGVFLTPEEPELREFLKLICDPVNQPVYVCCNLGIDRTSYYVAAYRIAVEGWTVDQAAKEMVAHGLKLWWPTFREYEDSLRSNEAFMRRVARELGSIRHDLSGGQRPCPCIDLDRETLAVKGPLNGLPHEKAQAR